MTEAPKPADEPMLETRTPSSLAKWWVLQLVLSVGMLYLVFSGVVVTYQGPAAVAAVVFVLFVGTAAFRIRCSRCRWPLWRDPARPRPFAYRPYPSRRCRKCGADLWRY